MSLKLHEYDKKHIELYEIFCHENSRVVQNIVISHILPTIDEIGLDFCTKNLKRPQKPELKFRLFKLQSATYYQF